MKSLSTTKDRSSPLLLTAINSWVHENLLHPVTPIRNPRCQENVEYPVLFVKELDVATFSLAEVRKAPTCVLMVKADVTWCSSTPWAASGES